MLQQELLKMVIDALSQAKVDYMLTGSLVSSFQGEPRATHDIDIVVTVQAKDVDNLAAAFPSSSYYFDKRAAEEAISRNSLFSLVDLAGGTKIDFWPLQDDAFDRSRFLRRERKILFGVETMISSPEDTILMKLRWAAKSGGSRKQMTDALRVYEVQRERLDLQYLDDWAVRLRIQDLWEQIKRGSGDD